MRASGAVGLALLALPFAPGGGPAADRRGGTAVEHAARPLQVPVRAAFYESRYPTAWRRGAIFPAARERPSSGLYALSIGLVKRQIAAMSYGGITAGIAPWDGRRSLSDRRVPTLLRAARGTPFRWSLQVSGRRIVGSARRRAALTSIARRYGKNPSYLRRNGRVVIFVANSGTSCGAASRWIAANRAGAFLMLQAFPGHRLCVRQPAGWYGADAAAPSSVTISPGRYPISRSAPTVARDIGRWQRDVAEMAASGAAFQLIDSFNDWADGSAVESAREWPSASGYGAYLDVLATGGAAAGPGGVIASGAGSASGERPPAVPTTTATVTTTTAPVPVQPPAPPAEPPPPPAPLPPQTAPLDPPPLPENPPVDPGPIEPPLTTPTDPPPPEPEPDPLPSPPVDGDYVIAAAGDIACDPGQSSSSGCREDETADLMADMDPLHAVLPLGDNAYYCGSLQAFQGSYDRTWGRFKRITRPAIGNHEYLTGPGSGAATGCDITNTGARGYYTYFGKAAGSPGKGYYSYNLGENWHLIALNSQCSGAGGCSSGSPQDKWLVKDLKANRHKCILAYWHIPLFSSGGRANDNSRNFWQRLYAAGADVVLTGHDHIYERFAPQDPNGFPDRARGIRQFIVGTGGANHTSLELRVPNSDVYNVDTFGVLRMTLHEDSYDWEFVPVPGESFSDSGAASCHNR